MNKAHILTAAITDCQSCYPDIPAKNFSDVLEAAKTLTKIIEIMPREHDACYPSDVNHDIRQILKRGGWV